MPSRRDPMSTVFVIRWIIIGLAAVIALTLLASGHVVIGVLLGALTVLRIVMFVKLQQRRTELRRRFPNRFRNG